MNKWITAEQIIARRALRKARDAERLAKREAAAATAKARDAERLAKREAAAATAKAREEGKQGMTRSAHARRLQVHRAKSMPGAPRVDRRSAKWQRHLETFYGE